MRPQAQTLFPAGLDAPTPARTVGLPPRGGQYFLSKRKKVPKKASGTATTGKRLLLPILTAGLAMSRAMELDSYYLRLERARARLFPPSKWAGLFPSAAYRRSAPPQLTLGRLQWRYLGCFGEAWMASQRKRPPEFQNYIGLLREPQDLPSSDGLYQPAGRKSHQTREPRGLSPSGGKTPDNPHVPLRPCAP